MFAFRPDPEPSERAALELALERFLAREEARPAAHLSRWRRAALEEAVAPPDENESDGFQAGAPPRSRGAIGA